MSRGSEAKVFSLPGAESGSLPPLTAVAQEESLGRGPPASTWHPGQGWLAPRSLAP